MTTRYFDVKTLNPKFVDDFFWTLGEIADRKVILFGDIEIYEKLKEKFYLDKLNVVGISKTGFENNTPENYGDFKAVNPRELINWDFDVILVLSENPLNDREFLCIDCNLGHKEVKLVFNSLLPQEFELINYLESINFSKNLNRIADKYQNKNIVIYGATKLFDVANRYYNLSKLNIIGVCDENFENHYDNEEYYGYKKLNLQEVKNIVPDCLLVADKDYIKVMETLVYSALKDSGILIKPLARKSFFDVLKEIWC